MNTPRLEGLIAATYTPLKTNGSVNVDAIESIVEHLIKKGISGFYVCGSTGEGMSLTSDERKIVAQAYVKATQDIPVVVQVGHNSIAEARSLAQHASEIGADIISATCPSYFKVESVEGLIDCMAEIASGAPDIPFYYYHIPALTGSSIDVVEFLKLAGNRIPNLVGLKYTDTKLHEFQQCLELEDGRFDVVWGCDEMLLGAWATGAKGAIGSTYNIAAPLYQKMIAALNENDLPKARHLQSLSIKMIQEIYKYPFHSAMKTVLNSLGLEMGTCRLPQGQLSDKEAQDLHFELKAIGFEQWS